MKEGKTGPAELVQISPAKKAVIAGAGAVYVLEGRVSFYLDDREMLRLVEHWLAHQRARRGGDLPPSIREAVERPLSPDEAETAES